MDEFKNFVITKEDGTKELCMVAFTYDSPEYKKKYVAYTNGKFNSEGKLEMYTSILEGGTPDNPILKSITNAEEQYMMYDRLIEFENEVNEFIKKQKEAGIGSN